MTADPITRDGLAVAQARVLLLLDQRQAASAILVDVAGRPNGRYAPAATALLGAMKLAEGAYDPARKLLLQALAIPGEWPGRAEADADLGLAYLSSGDESLGLRWLAAAREKFRAAGAVDLLGQSWQNEARYWEATGRASEAAKARELARALESTPATSATRATPP
ncbi:MAG: hypothetical protein FJ304_23075 [Planctomycetes bacterium]|nr:hypothetical protein [Planctomycetota bacterium]